MKAKKVIRAVIAEDDPDQRRILKYLLKQFPEFKIIAEAGNGKKAFDQIRKLYPDVAFVDIEMPGMNGIELAKKIKNLEYTPLFVFFTVFPEYAVDGFEVDAVDYLVKPVQPERFKKTVEKIKRTLDIGGEPAKPKEEKEYLRFISVIVNDHSRVVALGDVVYFSVKEGTVFAHLRQFVGPIRYRSIRQLEVELDPKQFVRIHRKYLINVNKIKEIVPWFKGTYQVLMADTQESQLPMSRRGMRELRRLVRW
jgi:two-component system LytT family response regulator/two-component system response regulator LytT